MIVFKIIGYIAAIIAFMCLVVITGIVITTPLFMSVTILIVIIRWWYREVVRMLWGQEPPWKKASTRVR